MFRLYAPDPSDSYSSAYMLLYALKLSDLSGVCVRVRVRVRVCVCVYIPNLFPIFI